MAIALLLLFLALDCAQTTMVFRRPGRWRERNPIINALAGMAGTVNGQVAAVVLYFAAFAAIALGLAHDHPFVLAVPCATEAVCIAINWRNGIRVTRWGA